MRFKKRLNNNVVVALDKHQNEQILMGKGLGFQMQVGAKVDPDRIEKVYTLKDTQANQRLQELFGTIPEPYVDLAEDIVNYARIHIPNKIDESVIVSLCDHMYMAIERKKQGIEVRNVMLWDIQRFYMDEYAVGNYALDLIQQRFSIRLTDDEAGFIAMHLVGAQLEVKNNPVKEITQVMQEIEKIVRMTFSITLDVDSVYYYRFITHLKFFAQRLFMKETYESKDMDTMLDLIRHKYPKEFECAEKIGKFIHTKYHYDLSEEEKLYLSIHISRIVEVSS